MDKPIEINSNQMRAIRISISMEEYNRLKRCETELIQLRLRLQQAIRDIKADYKRIKAERQKRRNKRHEEQTRREERSDS